MKIHLGHHFFGAGNVGDDFMLGGFLAELGERARPAGLTACVPQGRPALAGRFPRVEWRPYTGEERRSCIQDCDIWLGLGGAPWQSAVSSWFAQHLAGEAEMCAAAGKPMYFLGVGGQDRAAYALPGLRRAALQAERIWTRDEATAAALEAIAPPGRVRAGADLAHAFFLRHPPPAPAPGRLTAALNFDYAGWAGLDRALAALGRIPARERVWLAQEDRPLPGAERWLHQRLTEAERTAWRLQPTDTGGAPLEDVLRRWPSGQWTLASRYHATLAAAWAGSRAVVLATNDKLRGAAAECGYPLFDLGADPAGLADLLQDQPPPPRSRLEARAARARDACAEFFAAIGL